jgi:hypothetical protein
MRPTFPLRPIQSLGHKRMDRIYLVGLLAWRILKGCSQEKKKPR